MQSPLMAIATFGLNRIKRGRRTTTSIEGMRLWYVSGTVTDGMVEAIYQQSLCLIVGPEGVQLVSSFWLPAPLVSRYLIPWIDLRVADLSADRVVLECEGVNIKLWGAKVVEGFKRFKPQEGCSRMTPG